MISGVMYILSTGCQRRHLPKDPPPKRVACDYFILYAGDGKSVGYSGQEMVANATPVTTSTE